MYLKVFPHLPYYENNKIIFKRIVMNNVVIEGVTWFNSTCQIGIKRRIKGGAIENLCQDKVLFFI